MQNLGEQEQSAGADDPKQRSAKPTIGKNNKTKITVEAPDHLQCSGYEYPIDLPPQMGTNRFEVQLFICVLTHN